MLNKVLETINKYNMIKKSERILVGLSGGADSVSLLLCLHKLGFDVSACHINHQLRGNESMRDEEFCIDLCSRLDIPLEVHRINVKEYCEENSCSLEEGARKLRYDIFFRSDADKIATAHTLSDSFETMIFNLIRGTGLKGLCSIPPVRKNIIRPLIECTREEIETFLKGYNQDYVVDSTNLETDFSRNKIRLQAVPIFNTINPSLLSTFSKTIENLKNDENYLEIQTDLLLNDAKISNGYNAKLLNESHASLRNRAIAKILDKNNVRYSFEKIADIVSILSQGGKINLQSDIFAICENNIFKIKKIQSIRSERFSEYVNNNKEYNFFGKKVSFELIQIEKENVHKLLANSPIDYDKIKGKVLLRNRESGDKIRLCGRNFTSSVKKIFNSSVPVHLREKMVILCDDDGIIFVEGSGCADRVKVDSDTKKILICKIS